MPRIPTVRVQTSPMVGPPQSQATGEDFGAGIGRAVQGLGNTIQQVGGSFAQIGMERAQEERALDTANFYANNTFTETQNDIELNYPDPTGAGLSDTVRDANLKWIDDTVNAYLTAHPGDKKGADALRLKYLSQVPGNTDRAATNAYNLKLGNSKVLSESGLANQINNVRSNGAITDEQFVTALDAGYLVIDSQLGYDAVSKAEGKRRFLSDLSSARFDALSDAADDVHDMDLLDQQLNSPEWAERFTKEQYDQQIAELDARRTQIVSGNNAKVNAALGSLKGRAAAGMIIPAEEMTRTLDLITKHGMTDTQAMEWAEINIQNSEAMIRQGLTPAEQDQRDRDLKAGVVVRGGGAGAARITYANTGSTRNLPLSGRLSNVYSQAAAAAGVDEIRVVSGGQPKIGTSKRRTGSVRHDELHPGEGGEAGDIQLFRNGKLLHMNNPADLPYIVAFMRSAWQLGAQGQGAGIAYMGSSTIHVGFGNRAVWGAGGKGENAPPWLKEIAGLPAVAAPPSTGGGGMTNYRNAIGFIETGGEAVPYTTVTASGALGRYGIMRDNLAEWSKAALGRSISETEFLNNSELQDQIFDHRFGMYVKKYGPNFAAAAWFAGEDGMKNLQSQDMLGTDVKEYMAKFAAAMGNANAYTYNGGVDQETFIRLNTGEQITSRQNAAINNDPMTYAQDNGFIPPQPALTLGSTPEEYKAYEQAFLEVADRFDLTEDQKKPLNNVMLADMGNLMASNDAAKQLMALKNIANWSPQVQEYAHRQLGGIDPAFAQAGRALADGHGDTALAILEGRKLTKTADGLTMPWQEEANETYVDLVRNSLAGIDTTIRAGMKPSVDAVYAYNTRMGNGEFDPAAYEAAIEQVTGMNLDSVNGVKTLLPPDLPGTVLETAMSVMDIGQWTAISEAKLPPIDKLGREFEPWALDNATLFMIDDQGYYDVYVDGGRVMTATGQPFRLLIIPDQIKTIASEGVTEVERLIDQQTQMPALNPVGPSAGSPLLPGMETLAPIMPGAPTDQRTKDDKAAPVPPSPSPDMLGPARSLNMAAPPTGESWANTQKRIFETSLRVYRDTLEATSGLDQATIDRLVNEYTAKNRPK